jgi:hypothetical protein
MENCEICESVGLSGWYDNDSFWTFERHLAGHNRIHVYVQFRPKEEADRIISENNIQKDTPKQARFRELIRFLLDNGIKPTPTEILKRQGKNKFVMPTSQQTATYSGPCFYGGDLTRVRREEFIRAGWRPKETGRWHPPQQSI